MDGVVVVVVLVVVVGVRPRRAFAFPLLSLSLSLAQSGSAFFGRLASFLASLQHFLEEGEEREASKASSSGQEGGPPIDGWMERLLLPRFLTVHNSVGRSVGLRDGLCSCGVVANSVVGWFCYVF